MSAPVAEQTVPPAVLAGTALAGESLQAHRVDLETLLRLALGELSAVWRGLIGRPPREFRDGLAEALPPLAAEFGPAAATLGADWYDEMRDLAGGTGRFRAIPAVLPDQGRLDALVGWGTQPIFPRRRAVFDDDGDVIDNELPAPDFVTAESLVAGSWQRFVADMDRNTVMESLKADPQAKGWARQTTGESCPFCIMIASRGAVFSAETARFASHDNCDCVAVPVFGGDPRPVEKYTPSQRRMSPATRAANNKRVREYLRANS